MSNLSRRVRRRAHFIPVGESLESRQYLTAAPLLTEVMAANEGGLQDGFERSGDWIELYNPSDEAIALQGYRLTDDPQRVVAWSFPDATLAPHAYLVVFASGGTPGGVDDPLGYWHANFKLDSQGEYLALIAPDGSIASQLTPNGFPAQVVNVSYGRGGLPDGTYGDVGYQMTPTPGTPNQAMTELLSDFVRDTKYSVNRGFFAAPFDVAVTTATSGARIRYTLDGSAPTLNHGLDYSSPIHIDHTTLLRTAAFHDGFVPTNVDTQTYFFLADVSTQNGAGLPATWGTFPFSSTEANAGDPVPANYEIDPDVVNDPRYHDEFLSDLQTLPTMSLVLDPSDLWNETRGIYANTIKEGIDWERPGSLEMLDVAGHSQFQIDAGVRIHGGFGRRPEATAKHSFRLFFRGEYGAANLRYPLFGEDQVDQFDTLVLRANYNYSWARGNRGGEQTGRDYAIVTDRWGGVAWQDMGGLSTQGNFVHLYVNGLYWGIYNPTERPDAAFQASHRGGLASEYDVMSHDGLVDGTSAAWNSLLQLTAKPFIDDAAVEALLDVDNFIDYMIINQYGGNADWPQNNWYASRRRTDGDKWQFHVWDSEFFFVDLNRDRINDIPSSGPGQLFLNLLRSSEFRSRFADRIQRHLFGDGALTAGKNIERLNRLASPLNGAVVGESARWGDAWKNQVSPPRTRDDDWLPRLNVLRNTYFPQRSAIVIAQYRQRGLFPSTVAPTFSVSTGVIAPGTAVTIASSQANTVLYLTRDGSDPRLPGGGISPAALVVNGQPQTVEQSQRFTARAWRNGEWSPVVTASYTVQTRGDFNHDGQLNGQDLDLLCAAIDRGDSSPEFDLNGDGTTQLDDHSVYIDEVLHTHVGDANLDGVFDSLDLIAIFQAGQYEDSVTRNSHWDTGDWNCDGEFDTNDLVIAFQAGFYT